MASPNLSELVTTTLRKRQGKLADNVTNHNALLQRINMRDNRIEATGRTIVMELDYSENDTVKWFSGNETLNTSEQDVISAAEFDWKQLGGTITMNGLQKIQNSGKEAVINWLAARMKNLERSLKNQMGSSIFSDGTGDSSKEIGGLQYLVQDDPTSSEAVGSINQATYEFWQNNNTSFSGDLSISAVTSSNFQQGMNNLYLKLVRGEDKPDYAVAGNTYFTKFWESLQAIQRIGDAGVGASGFTSLKYLDMDVFYDQNCSNTRMYMLNTDFMKLAYSPQANFAVGETRLGINQDVQVTPVFWAGNLCVSNRALQGVLVA